MVITQPTGLIYPSTVSGFRIDASAPAPVNLLGIQWYDATALTSPAQPIALSPVIYKHNDMISCDAGSAQEITVVASGVSGDLASLQPTAVSAIPQIPYLGGSGSIYCVTGADGYIVSPARWANGGGKITVRRGNGPFEYIIRIQASKETSLAPYTISEGPDFPALYLSSQAAGVAFTIMQNQVPTGAVYPFASDVTVYPDPVYIDCPYVNNIEQLWGAMFRLLRINNSTQYTATCTLVADTILPNTGGKPPYYQIGKVPITQITAYRFYQNNHYWRPTRVTWKPDNQSADVEADEFTLAADFDTAFTGMTCAQWDAAMIAASGVAAPTMADFNAAPIFNGVH
jgi:hypothetical protein